jgi:hypothetical protein
MGANFDRWRREAEAVLLKWHHVDPGEVDELQWFRMYLRGDEAWEAAQYAANIAAQQPRGGR